MQQILKTILLHEVFSGCSSTEGYTIRSHYYGFQESIYLSFLTQVKKAGVGYPKVSGSCVAFALLNYMQAATNEV